MVLGWPHPAPASALAVVALCAAMAELAPTAEPARPRDAGSVGRRDQLCIPGGMQDYYAAVLGVELTEFGADDVRVSPVRLRPDAAELQACSFRRRS